MTTVPRLQLGYSNLAWEREVRDREPLFFDISAEFSLVVDDVTRYHEHLFPVVECAIEPTDWVGRSSEQQGHPFIFGTVESEALYQFGFVQSPSGWKVIAADDQTQSDSILTLEDVTQGVSRFLERLDAALHEWIGSSVQQLSGR